MKKLFMGILLPLFAFVSLVGAGFSTWYFDSQLSDSAVSTITGKVTDYAQVGTLEITKGSTGVTLTLDQTKNAQSGIVLSSEITAKYTKPTADSSYTPSDAGVVVTISVDLGTELSKHIELVNGFTASEVPEKGKIYTKTITTEMTTGENSYSLVSSDFAYISEPSSLSAYKTMFDECAGKTFTVTFKAEIAKPKAK
ncbi:MAG: hypothetical protein SO253_05995 [Bacilli bacterium]|nr:hypothetical protein [Bacilli bacterium]